MHTHTETFQQHGFLVFIVCRTPSSDFWFSANANERSAGGGLCLPNKRDCDHDLVSAKPCTATQRNDRIERARSGSNPATKRN